MSWANLDDRLHAHPKVRRLQRIPFAGAEAFGIWCWCLSWCRAFRPNDGALDPDDVAADWGCDPAHMGVIFALLVDVKLVDHLDGAYAIHDWCDWQLSPQQRGGIHAAQSATRSGGRFSARDRLSPADDGLSLAGGHPATAVSPAGPYLSTPLQTTPRHSEPVKTVEEIRRLEVAGGYRPGGAPVPKPTPRRK